MVRATHQIYLDTCFIFTKVVPISTFSTKPIVQSYREGLRLDQFDLGLQKVNQYCWWQVILVGLANWGETIVMAASRNPSKCLWALKLRPRFHAPPLWDFKTVRAQTCRDGPHLYSKCTSVGIWGGCESWLTGGGKGKRWKAVRALTSDQASIHYCQVEQSCQKNFIKSFFWISSGGLSLTI